MRPLRLRIQAFGPYAGCEEIDFRCLGDKSFFLVHGPTGGGKTTILDAMCFALYGDTSGDVRRGRDMRSHHADRDVLTEITFDFSLAGACYRVRRVPEQERPSKRGEGMTTQRPEAALWALHTESAPGEAPEKLVETNWSRVTDRIETILGFRSDQFRQVIMLPQGRFQDLLTETSRDREEILEILFNTEIYSRIEEALKAAAKELTDRMDDLGSRRTFVLGRAQAEDRPELEQHLKNLEADLAAEEKYLAQLRIRENREQARLQAARDLTARFAERDEAEAELDGFVAAEQAVEEKKKCLKLARKAGRLAAVEETMLERRAEAEESAKTLEEARSSLEAAEQRKSEAARALACEKRREGRRKTAAKKVLELESLAGQIDQLEKAGERMGELREKARSLNRDVREKRRGLKDLGTAIKTLEKTLAGAREKAADAPALLLRLERSRKNLEQRERLEKAQSRLMAERKTLRSLKKELEQTRTDHRAARDLLDRLERRWRSGQAGVLASELRKGEPCPVCGSTEHPDPAVLPPGVPDGASISLQIAAVEEAEKRRDRALEAHSTSRREISSLEAEVLSLEKSLGDAAALSLKSTRTEVGKLEKNLEAAKAAENDRTQAKTDLKHLREEEARAAKHLETDDLALKKAENALEGARAVVAERERKLPKNLRTAAQLEDALARARHDLKQLLEAFESASQRESDTREQYTETKAAAGGAESTFKAADRRARKAEGRFLKRLRAAGFSGPDEYEAARLEDGEIEDIAREIDEHEGGMKAAKLRLTRARQATARKKRPDLAALEQKAAAAKARCDAAIAKSAEIRKELARLSGLDEELASTEREIKGLERRYYVMGRIADVANGKNDRGVAFQRFILGALLDEVLGAATERLKVMSHGRYDLHRAGERADRRLAGGLDLEVFDTFTGYARPVSTLSGGETFLAALSLALGLADVVQAYAGGIHLETIFIDEGFGSLDPEALDLAVRALMDLQKGNRLVGIISHVPELKERIDVRLEVRRTAKGSSLGFTGV